VTDFSTDGSHGRDLRIDFFRGAALYVILIDHIEFNPLARFTYHRFGFSDAAEAFVFLSGLSCGIAYYSVLMHRGLQGLIAAVVKRTALIYMYYVVASVAIIWVKTTTAGSILRAGTLDEAFVACANNPWSAVWSAILLMEPPSLAGILVLYLALTIFAILVFLVGAERNASITLLVSGLLWLVPQFHQFGSIWKTLFPYFNPLAWQFLFAIGMFLGTRYHSRSRPPPRRRPRWLLLVAWAIVIVSFAYRLLPFLAKQLDIDLSWAQPYETRNEQFKYDLSGFRLAHFLSVALLVTTYVNASNSALRWGGELMIKTGRWSLQIFSLGTVLSLIVTIIFATRSASLIEKLIVNFSAVLLTALAAVALVKYYRPAKPIGAGSIALRAPDTSLTHLSEKQIWWVPWYLDSGGAPRPRRRGDRIISSRIYRSGLFVPQFTRGHVRLLGWFNL
jgi:hypothetical protein